ncbi:MAG: DUF2905 domain-containing protein [Saprospiraceae bacterium]|nr:DUF2905 domain-containing protein [Saprospiraceae bacterium]
MPALSKYLIAAGLVLLTLGVLVWVLQGRLGWLGRLPGDIRIERENFRFYFPITTMLVFSLLLNLLWRWWRWLADGSSGSGG